MDTVARARAFVAHCTSFPSCFESTSSLQREPLYLITMSESNVAVAAPTETLMLNMLDVLLRNASELLNPFETRTLCRRMLVDCDYHV